MMAYVLAHIVEYVPDISQRDRTLDDKAGSDCTTPCCLKQQRSILSNFKW